MASYSRVILPFAATAGIAAMLATATPAAAAEGAVTVSQAATKTAPSVIKPHVSRGTRISASYVDRVSPIRSDVDCSGGWCGRHFVLMVGVGY